MAWRPDGKETRAICDSQKKVCRTLETSLASIRCGPQARYLLWQGTLIIVTVQIACERTTTRMSRDLIAVQNP